MDLNENIERLKEDYERRLSTALESLINCPLDTEKESRLQTKIGCYRTIIYELTKTQNTN